MRARRWAFAAATCLSAAVLMMMIAAAIGRRAGFPVGRVRTDGGFRLDLGGKRVYLEYRARRPTSVGPPPFTNEVGSTATAEKRQQRTRELMTYQLWYDGLGRQVWVDGSVLSFGAVADVRQENDRWVSDGFLYVVSVSDWVVVLLSGALPLWWAVRLAWRRRVSARRLRRRRCIACGYDLRTHSGRCPECGTPVPESQARHNSG